MRALLILLAACSVSVNNVVARDAGAGGGESEGEGGGMGESEAEAEAESESESEAEAESEGDPACMGRVDGDTCGMAACASGMLTHAPTCDARGQCVAGTTVACPAAACNAAGDGCSEACTTACPNGTACDGDATCMSGHCADRYCCDTACDGACEACDAAGAQGTCSPTGAPGCGTSCGDCSTPPPPSCGDLSTLHVWGTPGTCGASGRCEFTRFDVPCGDGVCCEGACRSGRWSVETIPGTAGATYADGVVDSTGVVRVAYLAGSSVNVATSSTSTGWSVESIAAAVTEGSELNRPLIAGDSVGGVHLLFHGPRISSGLPLQYGHRDASSAWAVADPGAGVAGHYALATESDGTAHIAYVSAITNPFPIRYATRVGATWSTVPIETPADTGDDHRIALTVSGGIVRVAYNVHAGPTDATTLRFAFGSGSGAWTFESILITGSEPHGILLDPDGTVHLWDESTSRVRPATGGWDIESLPFPVISDRVFGGDGTDYLLDGGFEASRATGASDWTAETVAILPTGTSPSLAGPDDVVFAAPDGVHHARRLTCP